MRLDRRSDPDIANDTARASNDGRCRLDEMLRSHWLRSLGRHVFRLARYAEPEVGERDVVFGAPLWPDATARRGRIVCTLSVASTVLTGVAFLTDDIFRGGSATAAWRLLTPAGPTSPPRRRSPKCWPRASRMLIVHVRRRGHHMCARAYLRGRGHRVRFRGYAGA